MGLGSIVLGVLAVVCMIGGFLATLVPFVGTMLSFLSPLLALVGIVLGGVALSRSRSGGEESEGVAIGGLVTNVVVLVLPRWAPSWWRKRAFDSFSASMSLCSVIRTHVLIASQKKERSGDWVSHTAPLLITRSGAGPSRPCPESEPLPGLRRWASASG